jgi:hypothetical protein
VIFDGFRAQAELSVKNQLSTVGWAVLNRPVSPLLLGKSVRGQEHIDDSAFG